MSFSLSAPRYLLFVKLAVLLFSIAGPACASPWISVGETRLKQHLHLLNDTGVIQLSLSTWPLMWADVEKTISMVDHYNLNNAQKQALREVRFELRYQTRKEMKRSVELAAASSRTLFRDFDSAEYEKGRISHHFDWDGESMAFKLQANLNTDPGDGSVESHLYGSYIAGTMGEWVLGVGAVDRWWGAGNQSSLILSNNARPVPGLFLRTKQSQEFETPFLAWLGQWHFISFLGQLEESRTIPEAKLTGMRFTFQPIEDLEIGLSRAMMWGGDGRDENLSALWKSISSQGENETGTESGNQLAGYDLRYRLIRSDNFGLAAYVQMIGEDEAGYMPAKFMHQYGLEANFALASGDSLNSYIEYTDTTAGDAGDIAYEHSQYRSGYRHRGRAIAASYDNDAQVLALGLSHHQLAAAQSVSVVLSYLQLNDDNSPSGNTVSPVAFDLYRLNLSYQRLLLGGNFKLGVGYLSDLPDPVKDEYENFSVSLGWHYRF